MATTNQKVYSRTAWGQVTTANSALNGTGSMTQILTGALDGTTVNSITVKATGSTTQGMIRIFIAPSGGTKYLIAEIPVPARTQTSVVQAFAITLPSAFCINANDEVWASTQNTETFNIFIDAIDWENCSCG